MAVQYYEGIGRRKESTARVRVMNGSGKFIVNDHPAEEYFPRVGDLQQILAPIDAARMAQIEALYTQHIKPLVHQNW